MTREEAKDLLMSFINGGWSIQKYQFECCIDGIYDDFEKQLQPKTCEGCKYEETGIYINGASFSRCIK